LANIQRSQITDNNIGFQQSQTVDPITGAGRSQSDKFKERFDPTKIQAAPERATGLQKVQSKAKAATTKVASAIKMAASAILPGAGLVISGLQAIAPKTTVTQQVNKDHFNVRDDGRISGNPATDLYAGMNRTSDFGNLERAGNKRLSTREATAVRKGYTKDNDPTGFVAKTEKMKADASKYTACS